VRHLEEEQEGELLQVVLIRQPVVAQDVAVGPELLDDAVGGVAHDFEALAFDRRARLGCVPLADARSARMRSRRTDAGSSVGSWSTRRPSKAHLRMDWRRRVRRWLFVATSASAARAVVTSRSTSEVMRACSRSGASGTGRRST